MIFFHLRLKTQGESGQEIPVAQRDRNRPRRFRIRIAGQFRPKCTQFTVTACLNCYKLLILLVRPEGFEPPTLWFEAREATACHGITGIYVIPGNRVPVQRNGQVHLHGCQTDRQIDILPWARCVAVVAK